VAGCCGGLERGWAEIGGGRGALGGLGGTASAVQVERESDIVNPDTVSEAMKVVEVRGPVGAEVLGVLQGLQLELLLVASQSQNQP